MTTLRLNLTTWSARWSFFKRAVKGIWNGVVEIPYTPAASQPKSTRRDPHDFRTASSAADQDNFDRAFKHMDQVHAEMDRVHAEMDRWFEQPGRRRSR